MRDVQREHGKKDRGGPRYRSDSGSPARPSRFDRPKVGGGSFPRQGFRPDRAPRPDRDRGPRPPDRGPRPDRGARPDRSPRPSSGFRPDRGQAPRPDRDRPARFERPSGPSRFEPRPDRERAPRFERPERTERPGRPARPVRSDRPERPGHPTRPHPSSAGLGPPHAVPAPEQPPFARFRSLLGAYQQTAALLAGYSLGVFREIHRRPQSADDVARACASDPHATRTLLEALVALGALQRHGPTYVLPRDLAPYLVPGIDGDATGQIDMAFDLYQAWGDLALGVRNGEPRYPLTGDAILNGDAGRVRRYIRAVHTVSREAALRVTQMAPLLPGSSLLDVAGGSGIYAATYARQTPDLKAHLFDLGPTLDVARDILHAEGLEQPIEFHPGDYRHDPFPGPVDSILLSNVLQTESEEHAIGILRRSYDALRPGGSLLIHGVMPDAILPPDAPVALFSLQMFLLFGHGRAWSADQVSEWLAQERFGVRFVKPLGEPFYTKLILATRLE